MTLRGIHIAVLVSFGFASAMADEVLYRYEGDLLPLDPAAGWLVGNLCEGPCSESLEDGHYVLRWEVWGDLVNYGYRIAEPPDPPPPTLWVEWRMRSNQVIPVHSYSCDGRFSFDHYHVEEVVYSFGNAAVSFSGDDYIIGLNVEEFHTFRFESLDGADYGISVDGSVFIDALGTGPDNGYHTIQFGGDGGCALDEMPTINEWDFIRYGTISSGETIVASDPPGGVLDARCHGALDRFTVTFDSPNYLYLDDVQVEVSGGGILPQVIQTRRLDNGDPQTVEIVLDRPLPRGQTTTFTFLDGSVGGPITYTFAPGDTDGDGDADLRDFAAFQNCFGTASPIGACWALDVNADEVIDLPDFAVWESYMGAPEAEAHDEGCKAFDFDADDDVDLLDFAGFQRECGTIRAIRTYTTSPYHRK